VVHVEQDTASREADPDLAERVPARVDRLLSVADLRQPVRSVPDERVQQRHNRAGQVLSVVEDDRVLVCERSLVERVAGEQDDVLPVGEATLS